VAALILLIYSISLTISPAVVERTWETDYRWEHWLGYISWLILIIILHHQTSRRLANRDPFMMPIATLLVGWGLLAIWRLFPFFGLRQTLWMLVSSIVFMLGLRLPSDLDFLRRYKYLWLTSGLLLTALTLIFGTNPLGYGPRLWLGCCGFYIQPSEPLKLLLIIYLAAYLSDRQVHTTQTELSSSDDTSRTALLPMLAPTFILFSLALLLLLVQRDLGTASIFLFLYAIVVYISTSRKRILIIASLSLIVAGMVGYLLFDVVRLRIDAWLNPWIDPSGRSYQIVQSLLAIANGGLLGRGPGLGNPEVVPIPHSDFIFATIAEESGLIGSLGLLLLIALMATRGLHITMQARDIFHRYLAGGLTTYLVAQSILIIGGNLRLLPLTGVTLPFVSYGGSSLLTSFLALLLLLHISTQAEETEAIPGRLNRPYLQLSIFLMFGLAAVAKVNGWWAYNRGPDLLTRTDNPRRTIDDLSVLRGSILDRGNNIIASTIGPPGEYSRLISLPVLSPVIGYTNPIYGQSGIEASLDPYLRGLEGNLDLVVWWNQLLYGQPPPGLDIRLSLDKNLQQAANEALAGHSGALVLMNAENGEILAMSSFPSFDGNQLSEEWDDLMQAESSPLLNRATLGLYSTGDLEDTIFSDNTGLDSIPRIRLPINESLSHEENKLSPLQVVLAAAPISAHGSRPAPQIVLAVDSPQSGWILLPSLGDPIQSLDSDIANLRAAELAIADQNIWQYLVNTPSDSEQIITWYVGGSLTHREGTPFVVALILEENNLVLAESIGQNILQEAMMPE
jgi:cell division protein FtsW (lipid II flippase)